MAKDPAIIVSRPDLGIVDGSDSGDTPKGSFWDLQGFELRRGYPRAEYGRKKRNPTEISTGTRIKAGVYWERETGTSFNVVAVDGLLWKENSTTSYTPLSTLTDGVDSGTITANVITPSATAKFVHTYQVGDQFYFDADGASCRATVTAITVATFTVQTYGGAGTAGAYTVCRHFAGTEIDIVPAGKRLFVTDGSKRPHWFGDDGDGTDIFREAGIAAPTTDPALTLSAGSAMSTGVYQFAIAYEDAGGRIGNPKYLQKVNCASGRKAAIAAFPDAPSWVTRARIYRNKVDGDALYHITKDFTTLKGASSVTSSGDTVVTLNTGCPDLTIDAHINRYMEFVTTGNKFRIKDNASGTVTLAGATASTETATDLLKIEGGYDVDQVLASGHTDVSPDADLDVDHQVPTENDQPPTGLKYIHKFRGGGRLCALEDSSMTKVWFSGRTPLAPTALGTASNGEGEFDYWHNYHLAGPQDGEDVVAFFNIGRDTFAIRKRSLWKLYQEPNSVAEWQWYPVPGADEVGGESHMAVATKSGIAYFLGNDSQETDVIRFDGNMAYGMFRRKHRRFGGTWLRAVLDTIDTLDEATATIFQGRLLISYCYGTGTGSDDNRRTLDYDLKNQTVKIQPWGCGRFWNNHYRASDVNYMLCGAPTDVATIFQVFGTQQDNGGNIARTMTFAAFNYSVETTWSDIEVRYVHGETLTTAPAISFSTDGLQPDDSTKTWKTTLVGEDWPTTIGEGTVHQHFPAGTRAEKVDLKITGTDAEDWGVKRLLVRGIPKPRSKALGT